MTLRILFFTALCLLNGIVAWAGPLGWDNNKQGAFTMALARDGQGQIWIGTEDKGVWRYNAAAPEDQHWKQFTTRDGLGDDNGYAMAVDGRGRIWVGHLNHGVSVYNGQSWRNYDVTNGPLGERVFDMAVSPNDGDVWIATNAGLARYSMQEDSWGYYTRADGLPSDQIQCLAFDGNGDLYAGTQCDGLAFGSSVDGFRSWRVTQGPRTLPNAPAGAGLPSNLINDVLVARDNTVYAATPVGLARSGDGGQSWNYLRGSDWKAKVEGLYRKTEPQDVEGVTVGNINRTLLLEDYVTGLAQDANGLLWIGYWQKGYEARDAARDKRFFSASEEKDAADYATTWLPLPNGPVVLASYGQGLQVPAADKFKNSIVPNLTGVKPSPVVVAFPKFAVPPTVESLKTMLARVQGLSEPLPEGGGAYLGEDWTTWGDWVGRYGRRKAMLFATQTPASDEFTNDSYYSIDGNIGPHANADDMLRSWLHWIESDNPKVLYNPHLGYRREAEWDDHGEAYPQTHEGPDIWVSVDVPEGYHRLSLYFFNKDGHESRNRFRDYLVELKENGPSRNLFYSNLDKFPGSNPTPPDTRSRDEQWNAMLKEIRADAVRLENANLPTLAQTRVRDFWGPVYKQFVVRGPRRFYVKVSKNSSFNTTLQSVMLDSLGGPETRFDSRTLTHGGMTTTSYPQKFDSYQLDGLGKVQYHPDLSEVPLVEGNGEPSPSVETARKLWAELDAAYSKQNSVALQWPYRLLAYRSLADGWSHAQPGITPALLASWRWRLKLWTPKDRVTFQEVMSEGYKSYLAEKEARKGKTIVLRGNPDGSVEVVYGEPDELTKFLLDAAEKRNLLHQED